MPSRSPRIQLSEEQRVLRKRYLVATLITCIAVAMIFGALHVVKLGANRMNDMRAKAGYDLEDEHKHIRAAGEDIVLQERHESKKKADETYALAEVESLLKPEQWAEIDTTIKIPEGEFQMGTNSKRSDAQNQPEHKVNLPG